MAEIKSTAARVLADPDQTPDAKSLAGYVLGDADDTRTTAPVQPTRTKAELVRLLDAIEGKEGQHERRMAIQAQIDALEEAK